MFSLVHKNHGNLGEVKFSRAGAGAHFRGRTRGLALKYVCRGQENYRIRDQKLAVRGGQFIILPHHEDYQTYTKPTVGINQGICIDLNPGQFYRYFEAFEELDLLYGVVFSCGEFTELPRAIASLSDAPTLSAMQRLYEHLGQFSQEMSRIKEAISPAVKKTITQKELLSKLFKTRNLIHLHYKGSLKLEQLGREAGISPFHLNRLFKRCFGQTPHELQYELRMKNAHHLLHHEISLSQIALDLGYNDLAAFSRQFKKYYQESPSEFRKAL